MTPLMMCASTAWQAAGVGGECCSRHGGESQRTDFERWAWTALPDWLAEFAHRSRKAPPVSGPAGRGFCGPWRKRSLQGRCRSKTAPRFCGARPRPLHLAAPRSAITADKSEAPRRPTRAEYQRKDPAMGGTVLIAAAEGGEQPAIVKLLLASRGRM